MVQQRTTRTYLYELDFLQSLVAQLPPRSHRRKEDRTVGHGLVIGAAEID